ncbi:MAG: PDZ domain-containing protein [Lentisphaeraceae bacterium]|nr:PDZ domain-containing protein [Lentisphaeraceae bacterium]
MKNIVIICLLSICAWTVLGKESLNEKAFLGVSTSPISEAMKVQLSIDKALLVIRVLPDSPAAKAGIKLYDIILKVDGAPLDKQIRLASLIGSHQAGDEVELTLLRRTQEMKQKVTLQGRPNSFVSLDDEPSDFSVISEIEELHRRMSEMAQRGFSGRGVKMEDMMKRLFDMMRQSSRQRSKNQQEMFSLKGSCSSVIKSSDGLYDIRIEIMDGKKKVKVVDSKSGDVIFEGGINTEAEKKAMPESVRQKVINLDSSVNIIK